MKPPPKTVSKSAKAWRYGYYKVGWEMMDHVWVHPKERWDDTLEGLYIPAAIPTDTFTTPVLHCF